MKIKKWQFSQENVVWAIRILVYSCFQLFSNSLLLHNFVVEKRQNVSWSPWPTPRAPRLMQFLEQVWWEIFLTQADTRLLREWKKFKLFKKRHGFRIFWYFFALFNTFCTFWHFFALFDIVYSFLTLFAPFDTFFALSDTFRTLWHLFFTLF